MIYCLLLLSVLSYDTQEVLCSTSYNKAIVEFKIPVSEIKSQNIKPDFDKTSKSFTRLSLPGAGISETIGAPELPVIRKFVAIPVCTSVKLESKILNTENLTLSTPVYPRQPPLSKFSTLETKKFIINQDNYKLDDFLPHDRIRIVRICEIRGLRIAVVEIYPVVYNACRNSIEIATSIEITLNFISPNWSATQEKLLRLNNYDIGQKLILNYDYYKKLTYSNFAKGIKGPSLPIGYLIIVPDEYYSNILPLKNWKTQKGYHATVTKLSEIGDSTPGGIKDYINSAYNGWLIPPTFVLLVGDTEKIGYFTFVGFDNIHTDLNYSLMDTLDYLPDLYVSRFSISNSTQLDSLVKKTIKYERNDWLSSSNWCKKAYFIASSDPGSHQIAESTHIYCMEKSRAKGMFCDSLFIYSSSGTPISTAVDSGASWVIYSGHGGPTLWQDPGFSVTNVHNLLNTDKVPFVASFACYTGKFSTGECFTEAWERVGYRGAIVSLGSSVSSFWDEDDYLQRRMFDVMFDSGQTWVMGGINTAKLLFYQHYGDIPTTHEYFAMYNLIGDGSIDIYSDIPHPITVDYAKKLPLGGCTLSVFVKDNGLPVNNALVCVTTDSVYAGYTNGSGNVKLPIATAQPCTGKITATGHNLKTYEGSLAVVGIEEALPEITDFKLCALSTPAIKGQNIEFIMQGDRGPAILKIYDLSGRTVRSFIITPTPNSLLTNLKWDCKDDYGNKVRAGIYFYQLQPVVPPTPANGKNIFINKTEKLILL